MTRDVTVSILTFNGERYLDALLSAVEAQDFDGTVEVLVVDSGSTDRTLAIVAAHPSVRLHRIPQAEFGHGRTRNLVAELANGEFVAYLTHDAVPADTHWLRELVRPFRDDERIVAVVGKQVPRRNAPPLVKYDIQRVFERLGPDYGITVVADWGQLPDDGARAAAAFYSDANSAARRSVLRSTVPYPEVDYAEDQLFARQVLDAGLRKAYAPRAAVEHSNEVTLRNLGARIEADMVGLRSIGTVVAPVSLLAACAQWLKWSTMDALAIMVDRDYGAAAKVRWLLVNPWYHAVKWRAYRRATRRPVTVDPRAVGGRTGALG
jgi:rhamnosyltransferase